MGVFLMEAALRRHALSDDQFARIEHLLPGRPSHVGRNSDKGNRLFVEAVIWKLRTGAPWRDLPERFGDWKNTHKRFSRWAESGVWESLFKTLADDPDNEYVMIDATIVRAHQHSAGGSKKGGFERSDRPLARRIDDQDSRHRRCAGQSAGGEPHWRTRSRRKAGPSLEPGNRTRSPPRRQRL